jgi:hypothetical protein
VAGTRNYKPKYAPDFPVVTISAAQPGLTVTPAQLEAMSVLAPAPEPPPPLPFAASDGRKHTEKWPSYQKCLDAAPIGSSGHPKRTSADFAWCKIALSWGHSIKATAAGLMEERSKAQENGEAYARKTAEHAEYATRQRNAKQNPNHWRKP